MPNEYPCEKCKIKKAYAKMDFHWLDHEDCPVECPYKKKKGRKTMPNELKPCPFCLGEAVLKRETERVGFGMSDTYHFVQCEACKASSKRFGLLDADTELERKLNAIFSWNRRDDNEKN